MKIFSGLLLVVFLSLGTIDCTDQGVEGTRGPLQTDQWGNLALSFSTPPPDVHRVVALLTRQGFQPRSLELALTDSGAQGDFSGVEAGLWHLRVEAFGDSAHLLYAGDADVEVRPGEVSIVALQLLPASGGIHIIVTWGILPPNAGLMAHYPLDGNASDLSGHGNNGIVNGAVPTSDRHQVPNSALFFDGINDGISIPSSPTMHPLRQLTLAFWIRVDAVTNNYMPILHKGGEQVGYFENREYSIYLKANFDHPYFQLLVAGDGSGQHYLGSSGYLIHQWLFFVAVVDRQAHRMQVYVNGVLDTSTPDSYSTFNPNDFPLTIANEAETMFTDHSPFRGAIDDLRLYSRALTPMEIEALYNQ